VRTHILLEQGFCQANHIWNQTDYHRHGVFGGCFSYDKLYMLFPDNCISEELQRIYLTHEWKMQLWYNGNLPSELKSPDDPSFVFWLTRLDYLKYFSLFGEFMSAEATPYLFSLCDRLSDPSDNITIKTNNYFYHHGQYSEAPRNRQHKKNDLLLRLIRILNRAI